MTAMGQHWDSNGTARGERWDKATAIERDEGRIQSKPLESVVIIYTWASVVF